jgi:hypothetical protein
MRVFILAVFVLFMASCGKDSVPAEPTFAIPDGIWTYKTPDNGISVDFELKTTDGVLQIVNPASIKVGGTPGVAAALITGVTLPNIDEIRINANDIALVQPYSIKFTNCIVNSTFTQISVADADYTYPWGSLESLTNIAITRK